MKKFLILSFVLFCCFADASDKKIYADNSVGGYFIGKWGWVVSKVLLDDGLEHSDKRCYEKLSDFAIDNWHIELGTPCNSVERISPWLLSDDEANLKVYISKLKVLKQLFAYLFKEKIDLKLQVILVDEHSYFKGSFYSLNIITDDMPLHIYAPVKTNDKNLQDNSFFYAQLLDTATHEFFHLYNRKYTRKKNKQFKKVLKKRENDEAIALILGHCSHFAMGISGFDLQRGTDLEKWYKKGGQDVLNYQNLSADYPKSENLKAAMDKSRYGYAMGMITLWNQFGLDVLAEDTETVSEILKFCRYVTNHVPSIQEMNQIKPADYASEPEPEFYFERIKLL